MYLGHNNRAFTPPQAGYWFGAQLPTAPTRFTTTSSPPAAANTNRGSYYTPGVGGDSGMSLQTAINDAAAATGNKGDVIVVQAGTTYTNASTGYSLPARSGSGWIYIISSDAPELSGSGLPAAGTRVSASNLSSMASLRSSGTNIGGNIITRVTGAAYYRFVGCDIEVQDINRTGTNTPGYIVHMDNGDTSAATMANNITFDRCYFDGCPSSGVVHAVNLDGQYMEMTECCFGVNCFAVQQDSQCIWLNNSNGPFRIHNNFLWGAGEIMLTGGASQPSLLTPSDAVITNNSFFHQIWSGTVTCSTGSTALTVNSTVSGGLRISMNVWDGSTFVGLIVAGSGTSWTLNANAGVTLSGGACTGRESGKNAYEMKSGQRYLVNSNFFQNPGADGQSYCTPETIRKSVPASPVLQDIEISNNAWINSTFGAINTLWQDGTAVAGDVDTVPAARILYRNNLFLLYGPSANTNFIGVDSIANTGNTQGFGSHGIWDHNTFIALNGANDLISVAQANSALSLSNFVFTNNIFDKTSFEIHGTGATSWANTFPQFCTQPAFLNNVVNQGSQTYPGGNFNAASTAAIGFTSYGLSTAAAGYALSGGSSYKGAGVSGANLAYNSPGIPDGTDIGCNISTLPTS